LSAPGKEQIRKIPGTFVFKTEIENEDSEIITETDVPDQGRLDGIETMKEVEDGATGAGQGRLLIIGTKTVEKEDTGKREWS